LNSLVHYELELAHMYRQQLRHRATLWRLAVRRTTPGARLCHQLVRGG